MTNPSIIERELLTLERKYWQAIKDGDTSTAMRLSSDPCIVAGSQGVGRLDRRSMEKMMKSPSYKLNDFRIDDVQVQVLGENVAVLAYNVHENLTVEGKPLSLDAADASTWVRSNGHWVCALHTESLKGDPFGRDRQPMH